MRRLATLSYALAIVAMLSIGAGAQRYAGRSGQDIDFRLAIAGYDPELRFQEPSALALDEKSGVLYVADVKAGAIYKFSIEGGPKDQYGRKDDLGPAAGLAVDSDGKLYISEVAGGPVKAMDTKGQVTKIDLPKAEGEDPARPGRMTFDREGNLYVVDRAGCRIYVLDKDRKVRLTIGGKGDKRGQFKTLSDVAVDRHGRIYGLDSTGTPVQVFDKKGKYLYRFGFRGAGVEDVATPSGMFIDRNDQVWIVDSGQHCFKVFDRSGTFLRKIGTYGSDEGLLLQPVDAKMDKFGRIYVAESTGRRVQVFSLNRPFEPFEQIDMTGPNTW